MQLAAPQYVGQTRVHAQASGHAMAGDGLCRPHMAKLYGDEVRERSGIEQALLQKIPPKLVEEVRPLPFAGASVHKK